ncbi:MAG: DUF1801 domain-containing protein [Microbacteriaceae bacterium]|jgi:uncharacterized protein YdhG (YjbR/CyaY superfamily)|nr:DUF1801 domain-containing protein [Microbacteriaceae bacterium]NBS61214.1 DUF1801 domain-containing protein [Microbacteriaceae bacterium]NBS85564.1 DUF1801 domain-containing protein [Micrococcales bacterium]NDC19020.1 DUF1801 domain-containing protein [Microbacteriaceae bacterium]
MRKLERDEAELYFDLIPKSQAEVLLDLRARLVKLAKAEEDLIISYQLPTIRVEGKNFLAFAAWKDFYSIYLLSGRLGEFIADELTQGDLDKSTLRFAWNERVTDKTLKLLIKAKKEELAAKAR